MKQIKPKKLIILAAAIILIFGLLTGCGDSEPALNLPANEANTYQPAAGNSDTTGGNETPPETGAQEAPQDTPAENHQAPIVTHTHNITVINVTFGEAEIIPTALSMGDAAQLGAQYIQDVFGESINGMYVDMSFENWEHMTRATWHGAVSVNRRNTLEHRARMNELNEMFMERYNAGEDVDEIHEDMRDLFLTNTYTPARFYFSIDAETGMRIDISQLSYARANQPMQDPMAMETYIENEWGGDWTAAFEADVPAQEKEEIAQLAMQYAQRHFNTTTVTEIDSGTAFASLIYVGDGNFDRYYSMFFTVTDETGRNATVSIIVNGRELTSISTSANDMIPFEMEEGAFEARERGSED